MVDPNTRHEKRAPVSLKITFKSENLAQFIDRYAVDVSQGGIFIRTVKPLPVGTTMRFEFQFKDTSPLIAGDGTVVWTREPDPNRPAVAPGMGVRFDRLADGSQAVLAQILAQKAKHEPRAAAETKPPMFVDTPTRVAPIAALDEVTRVLPDVNLAAIAAAPGPARGLAATIPRNRVGAPPVDTIDDGFDEATRVRPIDEVLGEMAAAGDATLADIDDPDDDSTRHDDPTRLVLAAVPAAAIANDVRRSAPGFPALTPAPSAITPAPGLLPPPPTFTPPPAQAAIEPLPIRRSARLSAPGLVAPDSAAADTARDSSSSIGRRRSGDSIQIANQPPATSLPMPVPVRSKGPMLAMLALLVVAIAGAVVWYVVIRPKAATTKPTVARPTPAPATAPTPSPAPSSAGSATIAPSPTPAVPAAPQVELAISANIAGATVQIVDTDQRGPAPFTAQLEEGRAYVARVEAVGHVPQRIDLRGGGPAITVAMVRKGRVIRVDSDPSGAAIQLDGKDLRQRTPAELSLTEAQAKRATLRIGLRKPGFAYAQQAIAATDFVDEEQAEVASVKLAMVALRRPTTPRPRPDGDGDGDGDATDTPPATDPVVAPAPDPAPTEPAPPPAPAPAPTPAPAGSAGPTPTWAD